MIYKKAKLIRQFKDACISILDSFPVRKFAKHLTLINFCTWQICSVTNSSRQKNMQGNAWQPISLKIQQRNHLWCEIYPIDLWVILIKLVCKPNKSDQIGLLTKQLGGGLGSSWVMRNFGITGWFNRGQSLKYHTSVIFVQTNQIHPKVTSITSLTIQDVFMSNAKSNSLPTENPS